MASWQPYFHKKLFTPSPTPTTTPSPPNPGSCGIWRMILPDLVSCRESSWPQVKLTLPLLQVSLPCVLEGEFLALSQADPPLLQVPLQTEWTSYKNLDSTSTHPCRSAEANIVKSPRVEEQQFPAKASFSYSDQDFANREMVTSLKALEEVNAAPGMVQGCQG